MHAPVALAPDEPGVLQHTQVLGNGWQRHPMRSCQISHATIATREMLEDAPASRVGQSGESPVQAL